LYAFAGLPIYEKILISYEFLFVFEVLQMRARVTKNDVLPAIIRAASIADRRSVVPILSNVLLEFGKFGLKLKATDLDHSIIEIIPADVETFGTVAVPASTLGDIVKKSSDKAVFEFSLADKGNKLLIAVGKSKFELSTLDYNDFPEISNIKNTCNINIRSEDLNKLVSRTKISMSPEESRHNLNGVYFHKEDDMLKAASTDGHRLSTSQIPIDIKESIQGVIIAKKTVFEIKKLLDNFHDDVSMAFSANQAQFSFGNIVLVSKLVDGNFPDYKRVIPEMGKDFLVINRVKFSEIIDRMSVISEDKVRAIKLELKDNILYFHVSNSKVGCGKDEMEVIYSSGGNWNGGFNASYLLDVAQSLHGETLKIYIREALSPILIIDESEPESMYVIMPMRI
jgi:DNA polymerase-3 subunit beta